MHDNDYNDGRFKWAWQTLAEWQLQCFLRFRFPVQNLFPSGLTLILIHQPHNCNMTLFLRVPSIMSGQETNNHGVVQNALCGPTNGIVITNTNILLLIQHTDHHHQYYNSKLSTIAIIITTQAKETSFTQDLIITNIVIILIIITHPRNDLLEEA